MLNRPALIATVFAVTATAIVSSASGQTNGAVAPATTLPTTKPAFVPIDLGFETSDGAALELNAVKTSGPNRYHFYIEDGMRFDMPASGASLDPVLSTDQAASGSRSLKLSAVANPGTDRDRVELRVKHGRGDPELGRQPFRFGEDRWYGVKIFIDPSSQPPAPGQWLHINQLWQPHTVGKAKNVEWGIPSAMSFHPVKAGEPAQWSLYVVTKSDGSRTSLDLDNLIPGKWHDFTYNVMLSHSKDDITGHFRMWIDGNVVADETLDIGNFPRTDVALGFEALDAMDLRFGIYRKAQQADQTLYLDDVWFSDRPRDPALGRSQGATK
ncbi:MAG TPA: heparin lyase I family protein [Tepidisphaeraceae bacterium]|jgi:hypothetical protein|nr:heparin lyase I family protein [Tepidisphaeraceae bacterium]